MKKKEKEKLNYEFFRRRSTTANTTANTTTSSPPFSPITAGTGTGTSSSSVIADNSSSTMPSNMSLLTLSLSHPSFLNASISDSLTSTPLYAIHTRKNSTRVYRRDSIAQDTQICYIRWPSAASLRDAPLMPNIVVQMGKMKPKPAEDFLKFGPLFNSRKFNLPNYAHSLKWKRTGKNGSSFNLTSKAIKSPIATLEPSTSSNTSPPTNPILKILESATLIKDSSTTPQAEYRGVPTILVDYVVCTALLLVTDKDDYMDLKNIAGGSNTANNNEKEKAFGFGLGSGYDDDGYGETSTFHSLLINAQSGGQGQGQGQGQSLGQAPISPISNPPMQDDKLVAVHRWVEDVRLGLEDGVSGDVDANNNNGGGNDVIIIGNVDARTETDDIDTDTADVEEEEDRLREANKVLNAELGDVNLTIPGVGPFNDDDSSPPIHPYAYAYIGDAEIENGKNVQQRNIGVVVGTGTGRRATRMGGSKRNVELSRMFDEMLVVSGSSPSSSPSSRDGLSRSVDIDRRGSTSLNHAANLNEFGVISDRQFHHQQQQIHSRPGSAAGTVRSVGGGSGSRPLPRPPLTPSSAVPPAVPYQYSYPYHTRPSLPVPPVPFTNVGTGLGLSDVKGSWSQLQQGQGHPLSQLPISSVSSSAEREREREEGEGGSLNMGMSMGNNESEVTLVVLDDGTEAANVNTNTNTNDYSYYGYPPVLPPVLQPTLPLSLPLPLPNSPGSPPLLLPNPNNVSASVSARTRSPIPLPLPQGNVPAYPYPHPNPNMPVYSSPYPYPYPNINNSNANMNTTQRGVPGMPSSGIPAKLANEYSRVGVDAMSMASPTTTESYGSFGSYGYGGTGAYGGYMSDGGSVNVSPVSGSGSQYQQNQIQNQNQHLQHLRLQQSSTPLRAESIDAYTAHAMARPLPFQVVNVAGGDDDDENRERRGRRSRRNRLRYSNPNSDNVMGRDDANENEDANELENENGNENEDEDENEDVNENVNENDIASIRSYELEELPPPSYDSINWSNSNAARRMFAMQMQMNLNAQAGI